MVFITVTEAGTREWAAAVKNVTALLWENGKLWNFGLENQTATQT